MIAAIAVVAVVVVVVAAVVVAVVEISFLLVVAVILHTLLSMLVAALLSVQSVLMTITAAVIRFHAVGCSNVMIIHVFAVITVGFSCCRCFTFAFFFFVLVAIDAAVTVVTTVKLDTEPGDHVGHRWSCLFLVTTYILLQKMHVSGSSSGVVFHASSFGGRVFLPGWIYIAACQLGVVHSQQSCCCCCRRRC